MELLLYAVAGATGYLGVALVLRYAVKPPSALLIFVSTMFAMLCASGVAMSVLAADVLSKVERIALVEYYQGEEQYRPIEQPDGSVIRFRGSVDAAGNTVYKKIIWRPRQITLYQFIQIGLPIVLILMTPCIARGWMLARRLGIRRMDGYCSHCGYDRMGAPTGTCSECGQQSNAILHGRRRISILTAILFIYLSFIARTSIAGIMWTNRTSLVFIGGGNLCFNFDGPYIQKLADVYSTNPWFCPVVPFYSLLHLPMSTTGPVNAFYFGTSRWYILPNWLILAPLVLWLLVLLRRPIVPKLARTASIR